ncbi:MAG: pyridoxamine 5'-phosphate oxidase family protein [Bacteroidetes bacterium]|nr:pyridoxamine 5'-phosphate oxidase family protein [Bacteroidota bacterium]
MDIQDCIRFANENPVCFLATCEQGAPRVRCMGFWFADSNGFYFQSGTSKELIRQILINPAVEVCFYKPSGMIGESLRVSGEAEFIDDAELKKKVINDRPFLKSFGLDYDSPQLVIFRISRGKAHFWNMKSNFTPKEFIRFGENL